jgi:hypothetical protein
MLTLKEQANARGFDSIATWKKENRKAFKDFTRKSKSVKFTTEERELYSRLASILDSEFLKLI